MKNPLLRVLSVGVASMATFALLVFAVSPIMQRVHTARADDSPTFANITVLDPDGHNIAQAVMVCYHGPSGDCPTTEANGTKTVSLPAGHYQMQAQAAPGMSWGGSAWQDVDVIAGTTTNITIRLTSLLMRGKITLPDGVTGVRARVNINLPDYSWQTGVDTLEDGTYSLGNPGGFVAGDYMVQVFPGWGVSGYVQPDPKTVTLPTSVAQNFSLVAASKSITGRVTYSSGAAVTDARVMANKNDGSGHAEASVDGSGNYTLALSGGSWMLQLAPNSQTAAWVYTGKQVQITFASSTTSETATANFTVTSATNTVSGTVADKNGTRLTQGNIDFRTPDGTGTSTQIQPDGTYSVKLAAGTYQIFAWFPNGQYTLNGESVTVGENQTVTKNLTVQTKSASICGTVKDASGAAAAGVQLNAFQSRQTPGVPGVWSNATSGSDGSYCLYVVAGTYGVQIMQNPNAKYVATNSTFFEVTLATDTSAVTAADFPLLNFVVTQPDVTVTGRLVDASGNAVTNFNGGVSAHAAGSFNGGMHVPAQNGQYTLKLSSSIGSSIEIMPDSPPNSDYGGSPVTLAITAGGTYTQNLTLISKGNTTFQGSLIDSSGFAITKCDNVHGMIFLDSPSGSHAQAEIQSNCSYSTKLVPGSYRIGYNIQSSDFINRPPSENNVITIFADQTVIMNVTVTKGDAKVTVKLIDPNGKGVANAWVNLDNMQQIQQSRELDQGPKSGKGGPQQGDNGSGFDKKMPCGATDPQSVMKCCAKKENKKACQDFQIPDGPGGTKNLYDASQFCSKKENQDICSKGDNGSNKPGAPGGQNQGPQVGKDFTGPGGCKSQTECDAFCGKPENQKTCMEFKPPEQAQSVVRMSRIGATRKVTAAGSSGEKNGPANFDNAIRGGGNTDQNGIATVTLISGKMYRACAGLPPDSGYVAPKCVDVDLTTNKTATVVLQAAVADANVSGKVSLNGSAPSRAFVHMWCKDGGGTGQPLQGDGTYKLNAVSGTTCYIGADSFDGTTPYRSPEATVVIDKKGSYTRNLELVEGNFKLPEPQTQTFTCSQQASVQLSNGTEVTIPAGAISTSQDGTCTFSATPTVDLTSNSTNAVLAYGYQLSALDENGAQVTKLNSAITVKFNYSTEATAAGISSDNESALTVAVYSQDTQSWEALSCTMDTTNDTATCSLEHLSSYAVTSSSGATGSLATVTTKTSKGKTSFTVNKKSVTPFPKCTKGTVTIKTASFSGTQYIVAGCSNESSVKVYDTKGKIKKTLKAFSVNSIVLKDFTLDGCADLAVSPVSGSQVYVYDVCKKYKVKKVNIGGSGAITATGLETTIKGVSNLVTYADNAFKVFKYSKGKFSTMSFVASTLSIKSGTISYTPLTPTITSVSPKSKNGSSTSSMVTLTVKGKNLTSKTTALVGTNVAALVYGVNKAGTSAKLAFDISQLSSGKYDITLTDSTGANSTKKSVFTVK